MDKAFRSLEMIQDGETCLENPGGKKNLSTTPALHLPSDTSTVLSANAPLPTTKRPTDRPTDQPIGSLTDFLHSLPQTYKARAQFDVERNANKEEEEEEEEEEERTKGRESPTEAIVC